MINFNVEECLLIRIVRRMWFEPVSHYYKGAAELNATLQTKNRVKCIVSSLSHKFLLFIVYFIMSRFEINFWKLKNIKLKSTKCGGLYCLRQHGAWGQTSIKYVCLRNKKDFLVL